MEETMSGPIKKVTYRGRTEKYGPKDQFVMVDQYGTTIYYELQAIHNADVGGYFVSPSGNVPDEVVKNDPHYHDRIKESAKKYFLEHPEIKTHQVYEGYVDTTTYLCEMATEAAKQREAEGTATSMEKAWLYQREAVKENGQYLSKEQVLGETDLFDKEKAKEELDNEPAYEPRSSFEKAFMESGNRNAEEDLRSQMKKDANDANNAKNTEIEYNQENLNEDDANTLIKRVIEKQRE